MEKERIHWLDIAKGLLIILVVFGHIFQSLPQYTTAWDVIYSFHMPAFFIISGLTLNTATSFKTFFCKKIKHLMVPYLFFCIFTILLAVVKTFVGFYPSFPPMFTLDTLLITPSSYFSILWFLPCLFMAEVVFYVISMFSSHYSRFILCVICAFLSFTYIRLGYKPLPFMMNSAFFALPFIWFGSFLSNKVHDNVQTPHKKFKFLICLLLFASANILAETTLQTTYMFLSVTFSSLPIFICTSICGTLIVIVIAKQISNFRPLECLGCNSLYIYGFHFSILAVLQKIYLSTNLMVLSPLIYFMMLIIVAVLTIALSLILTFLFKSILHKF